MFCAPCSLKKRRAADDPIRGLLPRPAASSRGGAQLHANRSGTEPSSRYGFQICRDGELYPAAQHQTSEQARCLQANRSALAGTLSLQCGPSLPAPTARGRIHRRCQHRQRVRADGATATPTGLPDAGFCSGRGSSGRLGLCGHHYLGCHATTSVFFCHGSLPQPPDICGVHLRGAHGTLSLLPSKCFEVFLRHARGHHDR